MYIEMEKLFGVRFPVSKNFPLITKKHLETQLIGNDKLSNDILNFEKVFKKNGLEKFKHTKNRIYNIFVDNMLSSNLYAEFLSFDKYFDLKSVEKRNSKNKNNIIDFLMKNNSEDFYFYHIDIVSGNFNSYKYLLNKIMNKEEIQNDKVSRILSETNTFEEFLEKMVAEYDNFDTDELEILSVIKQSKAFRQALFGVLMPKKADELLRYMINTALEKIETLYPQYDTKIMISCSQDEITFAFPKNIITRENFLKLFEFSIDFPIRVEEHKYILIDEIKSNSKLDAKKYYVENIVDTNTNNIIKKTLKGVPKNLYIPMYRLYILKQPIQPEDLFTQVDGNVFQLVLFS